jgi:hypothetical protein
VREICFQKEMRDREAAADPREQDTKIDYTIGPIGAEEATEFIKRYEWLGTAGHAIARYCARNEFNEVAAVAVFGRPNVQSAGLCRKINPASLDETMLDDDDDRTYFKKVACLDRGACAHWAHPHTGSWFITKALQLAHDEHGLEIFYAYSDEEAGEIGTIYQACGWLYLGHGATRYGAIDRTKKTRVKKICRWVFRKYRQVEGQWIADGGWVTSRTFYAKGLSVREHVGVATDMDGKQTGWDEESEKWTPERAGFTDVKPYERKEAVAKHKYVQFVGDKATRRKWLKALRYPTFPYPKRGA